MKKYMNTSTGTVKTKVGWVRMLDPIARDLTKGKLSGAELFNRYVNNEDLILVEE